MWEELYKAHYRELFRYALAACQEEAPAEDLVQEVFLRAIQNVDTVEELGPNQRRAWLFRTLKNLLTDRYRRAALETAYVNALPREEPSGPEQGFEDLETTLLLQKLPEPDRTLFRMHYLEGTSAKELGELFGIPAAPSAPG